MYPLPEVPGVELVTPIGQGAQGLVIRGRRDDTDCAVKLPLPVRDDAHRLASHSRFLREAVALARVSNPALPAVFEVGRTQGIPYLVMELVRGERLTEVLRGGRLDEARALSIGASLAGALE